MRIHLSPIEAIRSQCLVCTGNHRKEVETCNGDGKIPNYHICPFHPYRLGKGRPSVKIIRKFCLQCMGGNKVFVKECETEDCPVHPYRMGKHPMRKGKGPSADRMAFVRSKKQVMSLKNAVNF